MLQETIIIPFTHLHLDRHSLRGKTEVAIGIEDQSVRLTIDGSSISLPGADRGN
jgi:hypothetical protein